MLSLRLTGLFKTVRLARVINSLVRVSRRVGWITDLLVVNPRAQHSEGTSRPHTQSHMHSPRQAGDLHMRGTCRSTPPVTAHSGTRLRVTTASQYGAARHAPGYNTCRNEAASYLPGAPRVRARHPSNRLRLRPLAAGKHPSALVEAQTAAHCWTHRATLQPASQAEPTPAARLRGSTRLPANGFTSC